MTRNCATGSGIASGQHECSAVSRDHFVALYRLALAVAWELAGFSSLVVTSLLSLSSSLSPSAVVLSMGEGEWSDSIVTLNL